MVVQNLSVALSRVFILRSFSPDTCQEESSTRRSREKSSYSAVVLKNRTSRK